jgi:hypothetical protein
MLEQVHRDDADFGHELGNKQHPEPLAEAEELGRFINYSGEIILPFG